MRPAWRRRTARMPLQNRVTPHVEIVAVSARGLFMGNRGVLHDSDRRLGRRRWAVKYWLICRLAFRGRQRAVMAPGRYTELFFLDEATAIAAGHRPCYDCRRRDYEARSEEHTSELQSLMRISYAVYCLKKKKTNNHSTSAR